MLWSHKMHDIENHIYFRKWEFSRSIRPEQALRERASWISTFRLRDYELLVGFSFEEIRKKESNFLNFLHVPKQIEYEPVVFWPTLAAHGHDALSELSGVFRRRHKETHDAFIFLRWQMETAMYFYCGTFYCMCLNTTGSYSICPAREPVDEFYEINNSPLADQIALVHECLWKPTKRIWFSLINDFAASLKQRILEFQGFRMINHGTFLK